MRRLYLQVYPAFLAIFVVFSVLVAVAWHHGALAAQDQDVLDGAALLIAERLKLVKDGEQHHWSQLREENRDYQESQPRKHPPVLGKVADDEVEQFDEQAAQNHHQQESFSFVP